MSEGGGGRSLPEHVWIYALMHVWTSTAVAHLCIYCIATGRANTLSIFLSWKKRKCCFRYCQNISAADLLCFQLVWNYYQLRCLIYPPPIIIRAKCALMRQKEREREEESIGVKCWHWCSLLHNSLIIRVLMLPRINHCSPCAVMRELWDMLNGTRPE